MLWVYVFLQVLCSGFLETEGSSKLLKPRHGKFGLRVLEKLGPGLKVTPEKPEVKAGSVREPSRVDVISTSTVSWLPVEFIFIEC